MKVTILGCGASAGVPLIGCECPVCTSSHSRNNRTRASILIETHGKRILVDTSPDLRQQALREGVKTVDAIIYTHAHADHCHGIDDIRAFNYHKGGPIPIYSNTNTIQELQSRFPFVFHKPKPEYGWFRASLEANECIFENGMCVVDIAGIKTTLFLQEHGPHIQTVGIRMGDFAYSTDCNALGAHVFSALEGIDTWVVDCLQEEPAYTHAHRALSLEWIEQLNPKNAILTHLSHVYDYEILSKELPPHISPAYDGMQLHFP